MNLSQGDKQTAEQVANRVSLDIVSASNVAELNRAINKASQDIGYLSDAEKTAIQSNLPELLSQVDAKNEKFDSNVKGRKLINSAQDVSNLDWLAGKIADQLPPNVDMEYRQLRTIKRGRRVNAKSM
ncbi:hypothetical protein [Halobacillus sp. KGW1]|uniref:hypothetical protein n=1 Tax=Halobacillus sp. KGW1 TaxID=1793726 RepID=UPI00129042AF|nr:hypothetical protein [Halobacillus sp. KGW1]